MVSPAPSAAAALAPALAALAPALPSEPHRLMPPEWLADELARDRAIGDVYLDHPDLDREPEAAPRGGSFSD